MRQSASLLAPTIQILCKEYTFWVKFFKICKGKFVTYIIAWYEIEEELKNLQQDHIQNI